MTKVIPALGLAACLGVLAIVIAPSPSGYPWSFRLQRVMWIPGAAELVKLNAQKLAMRDHEAGRHFLFGFGQGGTRINVDGCQVKYWRQYDPDRTDVPDWVTHGLAGRATVTCDASVDHSAVDFTLIEFGCLPTELAAMFGTEYNRTIVDVSAKGQS